MKLPFSIIILSFSVLSCIGCETKSEKAYLHFYATELNSNLSNRTSYSCDLYKDSSVVFSFEENKAYRWLTDKDNDLVITDESYSVYIDFHKPSAKYYFFLEYGDKTLKFISEEQDVKRAQEMENSYKPHYERMVDSVFVGNGISSGTKTEGSIILMNDENKTVYYAPDGMNEIETLYLHIGKEWTFLNDVYTVNLNGRQYKSTYSEKSGYCLTIDSLEYFLN